MKRPAASERSGPSPIDSLPISVLGSVALDTIETPTARRERLFGGSATYFAAAARLSTVVQLVSVVGEDFRHEDEATLRELGIDTTLLQRLSGSTYSWHGRYGEDYANATTLAKDVGVFQSYAPPSGVGHHGGGLFLGAIDPVIQRQVLDSSPRMTFTALDSREAWIEGSQTELIELAARVDFVFLNAFELTALTKVESAALGAQALLSSGARCVIVKRGAAGAELYSERQTLAVPAYSTTVVDPTGAGDAFAGGFMGTLANGGGNNAAALGAALRNGAAMASFTLESFGIESLAKLTHAELDQRAKTIECRTQD